MVHADRQYGPEQDRVSRNMEPTGDQDASRSGEKIGHGPDWAHVVRDERRDASRAHSVQAIAAMGPRCNAVPFSRKFAYCGDG
eukprot:9709963-Lingulodinium_polyedra.AAC.1